MAGAVIATFVHCLDWHKHGLRYVIGTRNTLWASIQSEAVPHVGNPFTECNFWVVPGEHPHCHALVEHGFSAQVSRSRPFDFGDGGALCAMPHSHAVCGGSLSTAGQIPADAERGPIDATLVVHNIAVPCSLMLVAGLQEWAGFRGAVIASSMSNWLSVLFLALYGKFPPTCTKTWMSCQGKHSMTFQPFARLPSYRLS